jgi:hypothetical protein
MNEARWEASPSPRINKKILSKFPGNNHNPTGKGG